MSGLLHLLVLSTAFLVTVDSATDVPIINHWSGGFQGEVCIPITIELDGWKAHLQFDADVSSIEVWVADATKISNREYLLENKDYNAAEHVGDKLCFTFIGHGNGDITPKTTVFIEGMDGSGSGSSGTTSGTGSGGSGTTSGGGGSTSGVGSQTTNKPAVVVVGNLIYFVVAIDSMVVTSE